MYFDLILMILFVGMFIGFIGTIISLKLLTVLSPDDTDHAAHSSP